MSRAELQQPAGKITQEVQQWASSMETDEESEIVAQFLAAPYPCQSDQLDDGREHHVLGGGTGIGECGGSMTMYWPPGNGTCYWPASSGCYYLGEPDVSLGINTLSCSTSIDLNLAGEKEIIRSESARLASDPPADDHRHRVRAGCLNGGNGDGSATAPLRPKRKVQAGHEAGGLGRPKKKARACVKKQGKKAVSKTAQKCSSGYCSDSESNCSQQSRRGEDHVAGGGGGNAKSRAGHALATDPQSLYAKRRREKINDRLRILQKLVPNGTKVDISTMLEEAVLYVKFLQQQIKMLSSDDLWMYAPIAYNGMSVGIDFRIPLPQ